MGAKQFFKKLGSDTKKFFSKGGAADVGLRKLGNTLSKVGDVAASAAPLVSMVAPEIGVPLMAAGGLAKLGGSSVKAGRGAIKAAGGDVGQALRNVTPIVQSTVEASKPLIGQAGMRGPQFA